MGEFMQRPSTLPTPLSPPPHSPSPTTPPPITPSVSCCTLRDASSRKKKKCGIGSGIASTAVAICLTVTFSVLSAYFGQLSNSQVYQSDFYNIVTMLVSGQPINTQYHDLVTFDLYSTSIPYPDYTVCQFDCSESSPKVRIVPLVFTMSDNTDIQSRRFARFASGGSAAEVSSYMLESSNFTFTLSLPSSLPDEPVSLYLFNDIATCGKFHDGDDYDVFHQVGPVLYLNASNGYSLSYTVPPDTEESYYCTLIDLRRNITFNYTMTAHVATYDVNFYRHLDQCVHTPNPNMGNVIVYIASLLRPDSLTYHRECVLFQQENTNSMLNVVASLSSSYAFYNYFSLIFLILALVFLVVAIVTAIVAAIAVCKLCSCGCLPFVSTKRMYLPILVEDTS